MILEANISSVKFLTLKRFKGPLYPLSLLTLLGSCSPSKNIIQFQGRTMGTTYIIKYYPDPQTPPLEEVKKQVEQKLLEVNQALSTYLPHSELSHINRDTKLKVFSLSPLFQKALKLSWQVFKESGGFFDPSVGPLVNLWGFGPNRHQNLPSQANIVQALSLVGLEKYHISENFKKLQRPHKKSYLDFSASAKGLGVDEVALVLKSLNIRDSMVEIGGEIRVHSLSDKIWNLAIEHPVKSTPQAIIALSNGSLATSGNYRNYFIQNGQNMLTPLILTRERPLLSVS